MFQDRKDSIPEEAEAQAQQVKNMALTEVSEENVVAKSAAAIVPEVEDSSKHSLTDEAEETWD